MTVFILIMVALAGLALYPLVRDQLQKKALASEAQPRASRKQSSVRNRSNARRIAVRQDRRGRSSDRKGKQGSGRRSFQAGSVQTGAVCCRAVQQLGEQRFLLDELPKLPLEACDRLHECACTFTYHGDRRVGDDRRAGNRAFGRYSKDGNLQVNRRCGIDRRKGFADVDLGDIIVS